MARSLLVRLLPLLAFAAVLVLHAAYVRNAAAKPSNGWADVGNVDQGWIGLGAYFQAQEYLTGLSHGIGAGYAAWAIGQFVWARRAALAAGTTGSVTLVGALIALGCFLSECCGSPMLGVYASMFGAKALGFGKPIMLGVTLVSVAVGVAMMKRTKCIGGAFGSGCSPTPSA